MRRGAGVCARWGAVAVVCAVAAAAARLCIGQEERRNWVGGGRPGMGTFENTVPAVYPWTGVDDLGFLRCAVAVPSCNPFVTKSNQFTYAWLGRSASFVDVDGDGLPDIVSPDGNGMFWFWKNLGAPGDPNFGAGEVMPLLMDDERSLFSPVFRQESSGQRSSPAPPGLSPAQQAEKRRVDERREQEFQRLKRANDRAPKGRQKNDRELRKMAEEKFPYSWEQKEGENPEDTSPIPAGRFNPGDRVPPGGLVCRLNTFRRLRLVACPVDWNGDGAVDFIAGDSAGTVYLGLNSGRPDSPRFGHAPRSTASIPLKTVRIPGEAGRAPRYEVVAFLNYAMPYACDWDGNGVPDLLLGEGTYSVNTVRLFSDVTRATAQSPPRETALFVGEDRTFLSPFAWDWDGDGAMDLFVCDADGRLTVHRRNGGVLESPRDCTLEGGNAVLAYCTPQPCDWNGDGVMDLIWGEPFGRIMVALGKEKGGTAFAAPFAVRSEYEPRYVRMPAGMGRAISVAGVAARCRSELGTGADGGTGDSRRLYLPNIPAKENIGGWPQWDNNPFYGIMPGWRADAPPPIEKQLDGDHSGLAESKQVSWGVAPFPGEVIEVIEEPGAPGAGNTLRIGWHDPSRNAVFKTPTAAPPQWSPGAALSIHSGRAGPFAQVFTKKAVTVKFWLRLEGEFSRLDVVFKTSWGPPGPDGKPPAEGGHFIFSNTSPPRGQWVEISHTEPPHATYERGVDGDLYIMLLGRGEVRVRDVRVYEGG